jgi:4-oxalocrotonate tautomerase
MWAGRDEEAKERIIRGITEVFVKEGVPPEAVTVVIQDVPRENWGMGGSPATRAR